MHVTKSWITDDDGGAFSFADDLDGAARYYTAKSKELDDMPLALPRVVGSPTWSGQTKDAALQWAGHLGRLGGYAGVRYEAAGKALDTLSSCIRTQAQIIKDKITSLPADWTVTEELVVFDQDGDSAPDVQQVINRAKTEMQNGVNTAVTALDGSLGHSSGVQPADMVNQHDDDIVHGRKPLPPDGEELKEFWDHLDEDQKMATFADHPDLGNHVGIPFAERDQFNRWHLQRMHADLLAGKGGDKGNIEGVEQALAHPWPKGSPPVLLTYLDDQGHAAVSVGNPDTARKVVTLVPGTGVDPRSMQEYTKNAMLMQHSAVIQSNGELGINDVFVTAWIGYDRPPNLVQAGFSSYAWNASDALDTWQSGLRVTHQGEPAYQTVIGHSYGSPTVGAAALAGHHLDADAVVMLAAPGGMAHSAAELDLNPGAKVFAARAAGDPIAVAQWRFGSDPCDWPDAFRFNTDRGGHGSYFDMRYCQILWIGEFQATSVPAG